MKEIVDVLRQSLEDEILSKGEKRFVKELVAEKSLSPDDLNFLRSKIYDLAHEKVTPSNYSFIIDWIKSANAALLAKSAEKSTAYFSPGESCRNAIINQINQTARILKICVFTISDDLISEAILAAHRRGVDIRILTDNDKAFDLGSDIDKFFKKGLIIKIDGTANHMHHKFMISDDHTLVTGSYNWTNSAARYNQENIIVTAEAGLIKPFLNEFDKLWNGMELYR